MGIEYDVIQDRRVILIHVSLDLEISKNVFLVKRRAYREYSGEKNKRLEEISVFDFGTRGLQKASILDFLTRRLEKIQTLTSTPEDFKRFQSSISAPEDFQKFSVLDIGTEDFKKL